MNNKPYGTIHRIASVPNVHGILSTAIEYCFKKVKDLRIDTHKENVIMRNGLKKLGFTYCGIIYLENGDPRLAFQKTIAINKYMTEKEKMGKGMPYYALDPELLKELGICQEECYNLSLTSTF